MFGKKRRPVMLALYNGNEEVLRIPLKDIALARDSVLKLSIRYFNDPEPCYIHSEAVRQRVMMELMEYRAEEAVPVSELDEALRPSFSQGDRLRVWEET